MDTCSGMLHDMYLCCCGRAEMSLAVSAVTQIDTPSQEEVDEVHQRFKTALKELFDNHKHLMPGWEAKELLIV